MLLDKHLKLGGFTLLEMAVVLVIIGLLLGGMLMPLASQNNQKKIQTTKDILHQAHDALLGYAILNNRLPCPASVASDGSPQPNNATTNCNQQHGFLPAREIGLVGQFNDDNLISDAWGNPIRYSLSNLNGGEYSNVITAQNVSTGFRVCSQSTCSNDQIIADKIVAVICSLGKNGAYPTSSTNQRENTDADNDFTMADYSEAVGSEFDDICRWISPNALVLELIRAGKL